MNQRSSKYFNSFALVLLGVPLVAGCQRHSADPSGQSPAGESAGAHTAAAPREVRPETPTDVDIRDSIQRRFVRDGSVPSTEIFVEVNGGVAELSGSVSNPLARERAGLLAESTRGVVSVSNQLVVRAPQRDDVAIQRDVEQALFADPATKSYKVKVSVEDQAVTLTGIVQSWYEQRMVGRAAMSVTGVKSVQNDVTAALRSQTRPDAALVNEIRARLAWDAMLDGRLLEVAVHDGRVKLAGAVASPAQKRRAAYDAWVPGVRGVDSDSVKVRPWVEAKQQPFAARADGNIRAAIERAMTLDPRVNSTSVKPVVNSGRVTLTGSVDNLRAKWAASQIAEDTLGVRGVDNRIIVTGSTVSDAALESKLKSTLKRDVITSEAASIHASVSRREANLTGTVATEGQRVRAEVLATRVPGIEKVDNDLELAEGAHAAFYDPFLDPYSPLPYPPITAKARDSDTPDGELVDDIRAELFWSPFVTASDVEVSVESGVATLAGTVNSGFERRHAVSNAYQAGALKVIDAMEVGP